MRLDGNLFSQTLKFCIEELRATIIIHAMKSTALSLALLILAGCASKTETLRQGTPGHIKAGATGHLSVGMAKQDVVALFGPPKTVSATADGEIFEYVEELPWWNWKTIIVTISKNRVVSYGSAAIAATRGQSPNTINDVRVGMNRDQVESIMGKPSSISAKDGIEYMTYTLGNEPYFVRLVSGKVDAFGRKGDFDSTQVPTTKQIIEIRQP